MKLDEIAPVQQVINKITHSPIPNTKKGELVKKYLKRKPKKAKPGKDLDGALPVSGGMFSGLF